MQINSDTASVSIKDRRHSKNLVRKISETGFNM